MGLFLCKSCQRHVRESVCPFCGSAEVAATTRAAPRLSRGAMLGAAAVAIACGTTSPGDDAGSDAASQDSGFDAIQAAYGGPFDASAVDATAKDAAPDSPVAAYGGPPTDGGNG